MRMGPTTRYSSGVPVGRSTKIAQARAEDDAGRTPAIVVEHEKVAAHYNLPALFLYRTVARRIREAMSSSASSQLTRSQRPSPRSPAG